MCLGWKRSVLRASQVRRIRAEFALGAGSLGDPTDLHIKYSRTLEFAVPLAPVFGAAGAALLVAIPRALLDAAGCWASSLLAVFRRISLPLELGSFG